MYGVEKWPVRSRSPAGDRHSSGRAGDDTSSPATGTAGRNGGWAERDDDADQAAGTSRGESQYRAGADPPQPRLTGRGRIAAPDHQPRYERPPRNYLAFLGLAAALCCYKRLVRLTT